jgi:hypothetical protein
MPASKIPAKEDTDSWILEGSSKESLWISNL